MCCENIVDAGVDFDVDADKDGKDDKMMVKGSARSGLEFFASRSFQGLDMNSNSNGPEPFIIGRTGKASGYDNETSKSTT